jgi:hypothetical protein
MLYITPISHFYSTIYMLTRQDRFDTVVAFVTKKKRKEKKSKCYILHSRHTPRLMLHITFLSHLFLACGWFRAFQLPPIAGLEVVFNHQFSEFWGGPATPIGQNYIYIY